MDEFEQKIARTISTYGLIPRKDMKIIVGLSGGADSVALLTALHRLGYTCTAAHCNFHLRGEESMRDMHHAISITQNLGIDLSIKHFDVPERQRQTGESIEMACRSLRYCWFTRLLEDTQSAAIAIAHHSGDNIETFFLNILRGTGLTGLTGIRHRNGTVIRPMLDCTRLEAEQYLARTHTQYITDSSNLTNEYKRNRLRNIILPQIEENFPGATGAISHTMDCLKESAAFYNEMVEEKRRQYFNPSTSSFDLQALSAEPSARLLLFEWLRPMGFNATRHPHPRISITHRRNIHRRRGATAHRPWPAHHHHHAASRHTGHIPRKPQRHNHISGIHNRHHTPYNRIQPHTRPQHNLPRCSHP